MRPQPSSPTYTNVRPTPLHIVHVLSSNIRNDVFPLPPHRQHSRPPILESPGAYTTTFPDEGELPLSSPTVPHDDGGKPVRAPATGARRSRYEDMGRMPPVMGATRKDAPGNTPEPYVARDVVAEGERSETLPGEEPPLDEL